MQIRHLPRHCCPVLDNVGGIRLASLESYTMSMRVAVSQKLRIKVAIFSEMSQKPKAKQIISFIFSRTIYDEFDDN